MTRRLFRKGDMVRCKLVPEAPPSEVQEDEVPGTNYVIVLNPETDDRVARIAKNLKLHKMALPTANGFGPTPDYVPRMPSAEGIERVCISEDLHESAAIPEDVLQKAILELGEQAPEGSHVVVESSKDSCTMVTAKRYNEDYVRGPSVKITPREPRVTYPSVTIKSKALLHGSITQMSDTRPDPLHPVLAQADYASLERSGVAVGDKHLGARLQEYAEGSDDPVRILSTLCLQGHLVQVSQVQAAHSALKAFYKGTAKNEHLARVIRDLEALLKEAS